MRIELCDDLVGIGDGVATALIAHCARRQARGEVPCLVLTGGRGGAQVLESLRLHPERGSADWARVRFLWGDERWLPAGDPERNDVLAEAFFAEAGVDPSLVHRVADPESGLSLDEAAERYAAVVDGLDGIDIALCGVGEDGHIASLFPGRAELLRTDHGIPSAIPVRDSPKPPPERVSLTLPALGRADEVWLLASGAGKRDAVRRIAAREALPAAMLGSRSRLVRLWADEAALG